MMARFCASVALRGISAGGRLAQSWSRELVGRVERRGTVVAVESRSCRLRVGVCWP